MEKQQVKNYHLGGVKYLDVRTKAVTFFKEDLVKKETVF